MTFNIHHYTYKTGLLKSLLIKSARKKVALVKKNRSVRGDVGVTLLHKTIAVCGRKQLIDNVL